MSDSLNELDRSEIPVARVLVSEIISSFAPKRSGTRVTRPSNFLRNEAMRSARWFKVSGPRFKVPPPHPPREKENCETNPFDVGRPFNVRGSRFKVFEKYETNPMRNRKLGTVKNGPNSGESG
jgi:hypothetical protein